MVKKIKVESQLELSFAQLSPNLFLDLLIFLRILVPKLWQKEESKKKAKNATKRKKRVSEIPFRVFEKKKSKKKKKKVLE